MGGRPTVVGLLAVAAAAWCAGAIAPPPAAAEFRIPGLFEFKPKAAQRKQVTRPTIPKRNPSRVTAGVSAAAVSPEIADNSEATVVVGTASAASVALALAPPERKEAAAETQAPETETAAMEPAAEEDSFSEALESADAAPEEDAEAKTTTVSDEQATETVSADESTDVTEPTEAAEPEEASTETAEAPAAQDSEAAQDTDDPIEEAEPVETAEAETYAADADATPTDAKPTGAVETAESAAPPDVTADAEPVETDTNDETAMADRSDGSDEDSRPTEAEQGDMDGDGTSADTAKTAPAETAPTEPNEVERPAEIAAVASPAVETSENAEDETAAPALEDTEPAAIETAKIEAVADPEEAAEPAEAPEQAKTPPYNASVVLDVSPPPDEVLAAVVAPVADATPSTDGEEETKAKDEESDEETKVAALTPPSAPAPGQEATEEETPTVEALDTAPSEDEKVEDEKVEAEEAPADNASADAEAENAADENAASSKSGESSEETSEAPSDEEAVAEEAAPPPPPAHPVVAAIRAKLEEPGQYKGAAASDLEALAALYGAREEPPLWISESGFSDKAKAIMAEIRKADDWGLQASSFELPAADAAPATEDAQADAEIKLSIAILSYARDAQIGRLSPSQVSKLFDQHPSLRDPKTVLTEMAASGAPDKYLLSLHPQHVPFRRLQGALVRARDSAKATGRRPEDDHNVQLIVINIERWRWLPRQLGNYHVWNNVPEFNVRVIKGDQVIYQEKTIVGQYKYATPFFSAPMRNIVFHPNWTVPPTIIKEDLAPKLQGPSGGGFFGNSKDAILRRYGLAVSYKGERISADTVDWNNVNIHAYTFTQDPGPANPLGQFKFNFPNRHAIYMHDTPQRELFAERTRTLSHGCIRVNQPDRFAALLLGEDKGWSMNQVRSLVAKGPGSSTVIALNRHVPVHLTYFTAMAGQDGTVSDFADFYGIDNRMASKLFSNPAHFPMPATPEVAESGSSSSTQAQAQRRRSGGGFDSFISGIFGN